MFESCGRRLKDRDLGLCNGHYQQYRAGKDLKPLQRQWPKGIVCAFSGCGRDRTDLEWCAGHARQFRDGRSMAPLQKQVKGGAWRVSSDGYVVKRTPGRKNRTTIFQHRVVLEEHIGRPLLSHETVHHKNGNRQDNRLSNLELWSKSQPAGQRVEDKVEWAKELLALYEPEALASN